MSLKVAEKEDVTQNENDHKKEESVEAGTAYWVVALFIGVIFITFVLAVTTKFFYRKCKLKAIKKTRRLGERVCLKCLNYIQYKFYYFNFANSLPNSF